MPPPEITIDLDSEYAGFHINALMHWPFDPLARQHWLVTVASQLMQGNRDTLPQVVDKELQKLTAARETSVAAVLAEVGGPEFQQQLELATASLNIPIEQDLFNPSGGYGRVATAGGMEAIQRDAANAGRKYGAACGELLIYMLQLDTHHPDVRASLNRATHIMVKRASKEKRVIPAERERKTMWTKWGGIAPLWAASALCEVAANVRGSRAVLHEPAYRREVISVARWITDWAIAFKSVGSKVPLLAADKVFRLECNLKAIKPEIPRLSPDQLIWADSYKAPIAPP